MGSITAKTCRTDMYDVMQTARILHPKFEYKQYLQILLLTACLQLPRPNSAFLRESNRMTPKYSNMLLGFQVQ